VFSALGRHVAAVEAAVAKLIGKHAVIADKYSQCINIQIGKRVTQQQHFSSQPERTNCHILQYLHE
jgi:hypothetical protein